MERRKHRASYTTKALVGYMRGKNERERGAWIVGTMFLSSNPGMEPLRVILEERLLKLGRFKSVYKNDVFGGAFYEQTDEEFDWEYHLAIPERLSKGEVTEKEVFEFCQNIALDETIQLDTKKPLWRCFLVPDVTQNKESKSVLIFVLHHAIGDGTSTVGVMYNLMDNPPFDPKKFSSKKQSLIESGEIKVVPKKEKKKISLTGFEKHKAKVSGMFKALTAVLGAGDTKNSLIKADHNKAAKKLMGRAEPRALDEFKELTKMLQAHEVTINDLLMTVLSMTLRAYFEETGEYRKGMKATANIPVSLKSLEKPLLEKNNPGNKFTSYSFPYCLNYSDPIECLFKVKKSLDQVKVSPQLPVQFVLGKYLYYMTPKVIFDQIFLRINSKGTSMLSNVAGPAEQMKIGGALVEEIVFNLYSPILVYFGLLSYNGKVNLSLSIDERLGVKPEDILKHWGAQLELLKKECNTFKEHLEKGNKLPKKSGPRKSLKIRLSSSEYR
eukprot:snap_masked-scaffold_9-processed-gene-7.38-mRNA-1 protein AED:1.00 eAED:1.00 QI:0/-1/0/0/-1/1/1/0/496